MCMVRMGTGIGISLLVHSHDYGTLPLVMITTLLSKLAQILHHFEKYKNNQMTEYATLVKYGYSYLYFN